MSGLENLIIGIAAHNFLDSSSSPLRQLNAWLAATLLTDTRTLLDKTNRIKPFTLRQ
jgi:hypothetical protein